MSRLPLRLPFFPLPGRKSREAVLLVPAGSPCGDAHDWRKEAGTRSHDYEECRNPQCRARRIVDLDPPLGTPPTEPIDVSWVHEMDRSPEIVGAERLFHRVLRVAP
ncbi:hypothetical protein [Longimicrobium sp.]|jgi:hypothetical protein|uniref:hypothetical protein n=1 Tax=Longimicrobium sp. TaxID=2029185 RepID=UPI002ED8E679